MDRISDFGSEDEGSNPSAATFKKLVKNFLSSFFYDNFHIEFYHKIF